MKISEFQNKIRDFYLENDKSRGLKSTFVWLVEEIGELATLLNKEKLNLIHISEELSDIIAWTISLANLLDIDMETALNRKYPSRCLKCGQTPCKC